MTQDVDIVRVLLISSRGAWTVREAIEAAPHVELAAEAVSADEAQCLVAVKAPGVIIVDLTEAGDGPARVQALRSAFPSIHVVALASSRDAEYVERILRAGALAYLTDLATEQEITEAIRSAAGGKAYVSRRIARKLLRHLMEADRTEPHARLTTREQEVFDRIGREDVEQIAGGLGLSPRTVESYCRKIREKLELASCSDLIEYARHRQSERA